MALNKKNFSHDIRSVFLTDTLSEKKHRKPKPIRCSHYVVMDRYNRFLIGWLGWRGHYGKFEEAYRFKTIEEAELQIKEVDFIDSHLELQVRRMETTITLC